MLLKWGAGPEGFSARSLRAISVLVLQVLLDILMILRTVMVCLQEPRTVFIPKKTDGSTPNDFRPITVPHVLLPLYHKVLSNRLAGMVNLTFRQRVFLPVDGCAENVFLLVTTLQEAKSRLVTLHLVSVDQKKAFDRVTTWAMCRAASRAGIHTTFAEHPRDIYRTSTSVLTFAGEALRVHPLREYGRAIHSHHCFST